MENYPINYEVNDEIRQITSYLLQKFCNNRVPVDIESVILQTDVYKDGQKFVIDLIKRINHKMCDKSLITRFNFRKKCFEIIINGEESLVRQRFSMAHGLGHIMLAHVSNEKHNKCIEDIEFKNDNIKSAEANFFAFRLLMPESKLNFFVDNKKHIEGIAQCFNVSKRTVEIYLKQLDSLNNNISSFKYNYIK